MTRAGRAIQKMKKTSFDLGGKQTTVGVLRESAPLLEAPFLVRDFNQKHGTNVRLIRLEVADYLAHKTLVWNHVKDGFPSPTDQILAYGDVDTPLGKEVVFKRGDEPRVIFTTGSYKGEKDIALVVKGITAEDIQRDGEDIVISVSEDRLIAVPEMARQSHGWYVPHAETGIPHGEMRRCSADTKRLDTISRGSFVGFTVFHIKVGYNWLPFLAADNSPSEPMGIAVEIPETDLKNQAIK